jgi:hypothetical protein
MSRVSYFNYDPKDFPFRDFESIIPAARVMVLVIPVHAIYNHGGRGQVGDVLDTDFARAYLQLIQLFAYIGLDMHSYEFTDHEGMKRTSFMTFLQRIPFLSEEQDEKSPRDTAAYLLWLVDNAVDAEGKCLDRSKHPLFMQQEKRRAERRGSRRAPQSSEAESEDADDEDEKQPGEAAAEPAPPARNARGNGRGANRAGSEKRIVNFGTITQSIVDHVMSARLKDRIRNSVGVEDINSLISSRLDYWAYSGLCDLYAYTNSTADSNRDGVRNLSDDKNTLNPERIFSVKRACLLLRMYFNSADSPYRGKVDPMYWQPRSYYSDNTRRRLVIPGNWVWPISKEDMQPYKLQVTFYPITKPAVRDRDNFQMIAKHVSNTLVAKRSREAGEDNQGDEDSDEDLDAEGVQMVSAHVARLCEVLGRAPNRAQGQHLLYIQYYSARFNAQIRPLWREYRYCHDDALRGDLFQRYRQAYLAFQTDGLAELDQMMTTRGEIPLALREISNWMNKYLKDNKKPNFFFRIPYKYKNVSVFANNLANFSDSMESAFALESLHSKAFLFWTALLDVFRYGRDHVHILHFGDPATGKGYLMTGVLGKLMIKGTYLTLTSFSDQSFHEGTCDNSYKPILCEEMPGTLLGVGMKPGQNSSTMEPSTNFKNMLTSTTLSRRVCTFDADKIRKILMIETEANHVWYGGTNLKAYQIDAPIRQRVLAAFEKSKRLSERRRGMAALISAAADDVDADGHIECHVRLCHIVQSLTALLCIAIDAEVLPGPDLSLFDDTSTDIFKLASARNIPNIGEIRDAGRLRTCLRSLVLHNAVFTYITSPLHSEEARNEPWSMTHLARIMPYAVCTVEMVIFIYGGFCETYRNPLRGELLRFVADKVLAVDSNSVGDSQKSKKYRDTNYQASWKPSSYAQLGNRAIQHNEAQKASLYYRVHQHELKATADEERRRQRGGGDQPAQILGGSYASVGSSAKNASAALFDFANVVAAEDNFSEKNARIVLMELTRELVDRTLQDSSGRPYTCLVPALVVKDEQVWIEKGMIDHLCNDSIVDIVWTVMKHIIPQDGRYVSGMPDKSMPWVYGVSDVKVGNKAAIKVSLGGYVNPQSRSNAELTAIGNGFANKRRCVNDARAMEVDAEEEEEDDPVMRQFENTVQQGELDDISDDEERNFRKSPQGVRELGGHHQFLNNRCEIRSARRMLRRLGVAEEEQAGITPTPFPQFQMTEIINRQQYAFNDPDADLMRKCMLREELAQPESRMYPDGYKKTVQDRLAAEGERKDGVRIVRLDTNTRRLVDVTEEKSINSVQHDPIGLASLSSPAAIAPPVPPANTAAARRSGSADRDLLPFRRINIEEDEVDAEDGQPQYKQTMELMRQIAQDRAEGVLPVSRTKPTNPFNNFFALKSRRQTSDSSNASRFNPETSENAASSSGLTALDHRRPPAPVIEDATHMPDDDFGGHHSQDSSDGGDLAKMFKSVDLGELGNFD